MRDFFLFFPLLPALCPAAAGWLHYATLEFPKCREITRDDDVTVLVTGGDRHHPGRETGAVSCKKKKKNKKNKRYCFIYTAFVLICK